MNCFSVEGTWGTSITTLVVGVCMLKLLIVPKESLRFDKVKYTIYASVSMYLSLAYNTTVIAANWNLPLPSYMQQIALYFLWDCDLSWRLQIWRVRALSSLSAATCSKGLMENVCWVCREDGNNKRKRIWKHQKQETGRLREITLRHCPWKWKIKSI